jgi:hypothetical protein
MAKILGYQTATNTTVYKETDAQEIEDMFKFLSSLNVDGHTISPGTQVGIRDGNGTLIPFYTMTEVIIPGGNNQSGASEVQLIAITPGKAPNNIGVNLAEIELIDSLAWVDRIVQNGVPLGGIDAENDRDYLNRLSQELTTLTPTPVLPQDFSVLARTVAGVQRAYTFDGYNPANDSINNERMVTVYSMDADGLNVTPAIQTNVKNYLDSLREVNFIINTDTFDVYNVKVLTNITIYQGYSAADVQARVVQRIQQFLDPAIWGIAPSDDPNFPTTWQNVTNINYISLATAVKTVLGVFGTNGIPVLVLRKHGFDIFLNVVPVH